MTVLNPMAGQFSAGTQLNRMLDSLGLPDKVGDLMGAALDARMGNVAGMRRNLFDAFNKVSTRGLDFKSQIGLPAFGSLRSPMKMLAMLPGMGLLGAYAAGSMSSFGAGGPLGAAGGFLNRMLCGPGCMSGADHARTGQSSPLDSSGADISAIVNNPNLSIEEKMALALMKMAEKQEQKLEAQLNKMSKPQGSPGSGGAGGIGGMGGIGGIGGILSGALGGLMTGGPIGAIFGGLGGILGGGSQGGQGGIAGGMAGGKSKESEQVAAQKLQMIQQKMSRLFDTLSNVMKSFHQSSMTAIRNIN